jgi:hypothetical protein
MMTCKEASESRERREAEKGEFSAAGTRRVMPCSGHCKVQIKLKLKRKSSCEDQVNRRIKKHEDSTDKKQE